MASRMDGASSASRRRRRPHGPRAAQRPSLHRVRATSTRRDVSRTFDGALGAHGDDETLRRDEFFAGNTHAPVQRIAGRPSADQTAATDASRRSRAVSRMPRARRRPKT